MIKDAKNHVLWGILTKKELKQQMELEAKIESNAQSKVVWEGWLNLVDEISNNLDIDPKSEAGMVIGRKCVLFLREIYGKEYMHLTIKIWERGLVKGKGMQAFGLTSKHVSWLGTAINSYWEKYTADVLSKIGNLASSEVLTLWYKMLDDMCGKDEEVKQAIFYRVLTNKKISQSAKDWLFFTHQ